MLRSKIVKNILGKARYVTGKALSGKTAIITGASGTIGVAAASVFALCDKQARDY